jgi:UDP-glucose 4-epimerase
VRCLVTGGAGYIGSIVAADLLAAGYEVVVADDLSTGHREAVPAGCEFVLLDLRDRKTLTELLNQGFTCVLHFAALSIVGDSMRRPETYFENNVGGCLSLLGAMIETGVDKLVFSSSAAVYGEPDTAPIEEAAPRRPTHPYGRTKVMMEEMMEVLGEARGLRHVSLRYFNAAGATREQGEDHRPETHLIPVLLEAAAGTRDRVEIFGDDYPTPDGTCIRDYVHVVDLARAHVLAVDALERGKAGAFNLGGGRGFSVREVIDAVERITGTRLPVSVAARRPGDPSVLVASSQRAERVLGWERRFPNLEDMVRSAWEWKRAHPSGYGDAS